MSRVIRNERARELQGQRAGIVSRGLAFAADVGIAFALYLLLVAGVNFLWDLFFSDKVEIPTPPGWVSGLAIFWILVIYLALGWGSTGRTIGKQLLGLRVVRADGHSLAPRVAFVRAFFCAAFYPGLLLAVLDRRNRSVQDVVCKTVVVYDWIPEAARPRVFPRGYQKQAAEPSGQPGA
ncbi:MAG: RDD family protein [Acidimicrobiia bacterium]|jgi:uncharacterized RDD family membrane protein YckC